MFSGKGSKLVQVRTAEEEAWICLQSLIRRKTSLLMFFYYQIITSFQQHDLYSLLAVFTIGMVLLLL